VSHCEARQQLGEAKQAGPIQTAPAGWLVVVKARAARATENRNIAARLRVMVHPFNVGPGIDPGRFNISQYIANYKCSGGLSGRKDTRDTKDLKDDKDNPCL
jgi:hypothetical protein